MTTVVWQRCGCGKRGFSSELLAHKALGRAQARRNRQYDRNGTRRGLVREGRVYQCEDSGMYHLTSQSRRAFVDASARWATGALSGEAA